MNAFLLIREYLDHSFHFSGKHRLVCILFFLLMCLLLADVCVVCEHNLNIPSFCPQFNLTLLQSSCCCCTGRIPQMVGEAHRHLLTYMLP